MLLHKLQYYCTELQKSLSKLDLLKKWGQRQGLLDWLVPTTHPVNFGSEMGEAKHVSGKNIFCSMKVYKSRGKRIFEIVHWPFELPPNQHRPTGPFGWHKWCSLAWPSKGQCTISKILSSLIFSLFIEQNIFFPETCFAYTISEPKFTVC